MDNEWRPADGNPLQRQAGSRGRGGGGVVGFKALYGQQHIIMFVNISLPSHVLKLTVFLQYYISVQSVIPCQRTHYLYHIRIQSNKISKMKHLMLVLAISLQSSAFNTYNYFHPTQHVCKCKVWERLPKNINCTPPDRDGGRQKVSVDSCWWLY